MSHLLFHVVITGNQYVFSSFAAENILISGIIFEKTWDGWA
jgi:hypothetical protein